MKKRITGICGIFLALALVFGGCGEKKLQPSGETENTTASFGNFKMGRDHAYMYPGLPYSIAETEEGYYFPGGESEMYLFYADKRSMKPIALCNKPDCLHEQEPDPAKKADCNAYMGGTDWLTYYDGALYYLGNYDISEDGCYVCKLSLDGTKKEKITLMPNISYSWFVFHRGKAYYVAKNSTDLETMESQPKIYSLDITQKDAKPELVYTRERKEGDLGGIFGYENYLYFDENYTEDEELTDHIVRLNLEKENEPEIISEGFGMHTIVRDTIIAGRRDGTTWTMKMDGAEKKSCLIYKDRITRRAA